MIDEEREVSGLGCSIICYLSSSSAVIQVLLMLFYDVMRLQLCTLLEIFKPEFFYLRLFRLQYHISMDVTRYEFLNHVTGIDREWSHKITSYL